MTGSPAGHPSAIFSTMSARLVGSQSRRSSPGQAGPGDRGSAGLLKGCGDEASALVAMAMILAAWLGQCWLRLAWASMGMPGDVLWPGRPASDPLPSGWSVVSSQKILAAKGSRSLAGRTLPARHAIEPGRKRG